jgi:hypothetical protein
MQVAVTDAGGLHFDEHFARSGRAEVDRFDGKRGPGFPENGGLDMH